jgi:NDP-sugar pyrophosphorylase family protein
MKAVILAGGYGKRLRPLTDEKPKSLLEVGDRPIIEWQIHWLKSFGIASFILLAGHLKDKLITHLGAGKRWGVNFAFLIEDEPLGTGGALKNAEHLLSNDKEFLVLNGDVITNLDLWKIKNNGNIASIALVPLKSPFGIIKTNEDKIVNFEEKPLLKEYWINAGVYMMSSKIFKYLPEKGDIEKLTFPKLARQNLLAATKFDDCYWRSIDSIKDIEEVGRDLSEKQVFA